MAQANEPTPAPAPTADAGADAEAPVPKKINWGGIVKGALIVTAVVVVGFVGFHLLSGIATSIIAKSTVAQGAVAGIGSIATWATGVVGTVWGAISGGAHALSTSIGLQPVIDSAWNGVTGLFSPSAMTASQASLATKAAGWLGAGVAVKAALPIAQHALSGTHVIVPDTQAMMPHDALPPDAMLTHAKSATQAHDVAHAAHQQSTLGKLGHHSAEHSEHSNKPAENWQAKVGGPRAAAPLAAKAPAANYTEQVTSDAANRTAAAAI